VHAPALVPSVRETTKPGPEPTRPKCVTLLQPKEIVMKGIIAYALGIPLVVIILLYVTDVF
jgi:hypothetical protein